jgi:hypothetical protein
MGITDKGFLNKQGNNNRRLKNQAGLWWWFLSPSQKKTCLCV